VANGQNTIVSTRTLAMVQVAVHDALNAIDVEALQRARNAGVTQPSAIARRYFPDSPAHQAVGARYLQDNIKYYLRDEDRAGLEAFYRYAAEAGLVPSAGSLQFYDVD